MKNTTLFMWRLQFIIALLVFTMSSNVNGQDAKNQKELYNQNAASIVEGAKFVKEGKHSNIPSWVIFNEQNEIAKTTFFTWFKSTFELDADLNFIEESFSKDEEGRIHTRYTIEYKDASVGENWLILHSKNGMVYSFNGNVYSLKSVNINPVLDEETALEIALQKIGAKTYLWQIPEEEASIKWRSNDETATNYPHGKLMLIRNVNTDTEASIVLVWRFDIREVTSEKDQQIFIDASNGNIIKSLPLTFYCDVGTTATTWYGTQNINTFEVGANDYKLLDDCGSGDVKTTDNGSDYSDSDNNWTEAGKSGPGTTHFHAMVTKDYFSTVHGRDSYNNSGGNLELRHIPNWANASSNGGGLIKVGANATDANYYNTLDVIAHEFTHSVMSSLANLDYSGESGALNESFADILGETCEIWYEGISAGSWDWLHREDYFNGENRSFVDPKDKSQPDTYNGTNWANTCGGCGDNGGVHTNSGVQNHWFYLIAVGGSGTNDNGDDYVVSGIGLTKSRFIAYDNLENQLGQTSDYSDARTGSIASTIAKYGDCSNELKQVINAWYAVGVGDPYVDADIASSSDISCFGLADGSITLDVDGSAPFTYLWNDGIMTKNRSGLGPGVYSVIVTDATGCSVSVGQLISEPDDLTAVATATSNYNGFNISCNGLSDGEATAVAAGGKSAYSYQWDANAGNQVTAIATNLSAGSYWVTVTDANGCSTAANVLLTEPDPLVASISAVSNYNGYNISCNGGSDGWATASGAGGVAPYTYDWSNGQTTATATDLMAGTYYVTITDANGCDDETMVTLTEPTPLTIEAGDNQTVYYGYPPAECADISWSGAGGGVPPYTISWNDGGSETHEVCPGEFTTVYTVTITDANGCIETDDVTICVIDVRCGKKLDKVELCHVPPDDPGNEHTICVSINAVATHLAEGDMLASCGTDHSCPPEKSNRAISFDDDYVNTIGAYPNPFNQSTRIEFSSSLEGNVTMKLYEVSGKEIAVLFNATVKANEINTVELDQNLAKPGVNICLIQYADGSTEAFKLIFNQ